MLKFSGELSDEAERLFKLSKEIPLNKPGLPCGVEICVDDILPIAELLLTNRVTAEHDVAGYIWIKAVN